MSNKAEQDRLQKYNSHGKGKKEDDQNWKMDILTSGKEDNEMAKLRKIEQNYRFLNIYF